MCSATSILKSVYCLKETHSVQFSCSVMSDSLRPHELQHARPPCPLPTPGVYSNSCPLSWWCHPVTLSSVIPSSSCPQSHPASGSFPVSQLFTWCGQSTGVSASASVLPMNTQDWSPLGWTGWISFQSKGLSRVFSNTTVQKHQFFGVQLSSQSNSHIHTWPLEKPALIRQTFVGQVMSLLFNMLSRLVITFLPRSKRLLISWLQSPSAVILEPPKIKSDTVSTVSPWKYISSHKWKSNHNTHFSFGLSRGSMVLSRILSILFCWTIDCCQFEPV